MIRGGESRERESRYPFTSHVSHVKIPSRHRQKRRSRNLKWPSLPAAEGADLTVVHMSFNYANSAHLLFDGNVLLAHILSIVWKKFVSMIQGTSPLRHGSGAEEMAGKRAHFHSRIGGGGRRGRTSASSLGLSSGEACTTLSIDMTINSCNMLSSLIILDSPTLALLLHMFVDSLQFSVEC